MDRVPADTPHHPDSDLAGPDGTANGTRTGDVPADMTPASDDGRGNEVSALAYELLLPGSVTAIASIGVAGSPVLARIRRDGTTMNWCELAGAASKAVSNTTSGPCATLTSDGRSLPFPPASLDAVVLHETLDHWPDPRTLLAAAAEALKPGGVVAVSVANLWDPAHIRRRLGLAGARLEPSGPGKPRSLRGYRRLLRQAGFTPAASYFVLQRPNAAPSCIISTNYRPATAYFSHQVATLTGPKRLLMRGLNAINLLPQVQSRFLIMARK